MATPNKGRRPPRPPKAQGKPVRALLILVAAMVGLTGGMFLTGETTPRLGIDLAGGTSITLTAQEQPGDKDAINPTNLKTAASIIERRVNGLGVSEAEVKTQGDRNIIVNIPKGTKEKEARKQVGTTAKLNFRPVLTVAPTGGKGKPSPSPSASKGETSQGGGTDKGTDKQDGSNEGSGDEKSRSQASASPSASSSASGDSSPQTSTQGHAVALKDKPSSSPSPSSSATSSPDAKPSPPAPRPGSGLPAELRKKLRELDCSTAKGRAEARRTAARTKASEPVATCDKDRPVKYALGPVAVKGKHVEDASAVYDQQRGQGWIVQMSFDDKGSAAFADVTGELAKNMRPKNQFAIVLDGEVVSAPSVSQRLTGDAQISGNFQQDEAEELANILSYGALPLTFEESNVTTISATLGAEQLRAGLIAGAIGLALVVVYLLFYYRLLGAIAIASLLVAGVLTYTIMTLLGPAIGFALSLPAICGAIVAIGITADSFIVYFERVRDEVREGRRVRSGIVRAWPHARRTIVVSDVVSVLAAVVLFVVSVGSVQGFAFVLGLTTLVDLAIVFLLTKPMMMILGNKPYFAEGRSWSGLSPERLGVRPPIRGRRHPASASSEPKEV